MKPMEEHEWVLVAPGQMERQRGVGESLAERAGAVEGTGGVGSPTRKFLGELGQWRCAVGLPPKQLGELDLGGPSPCEQGTEGSRRGEPRGSSGTCE